MEQPKFDDTNGNSFVVCPFDSTHILLPGRVLRHLLKCKRNNKTHDMLHCPYATSHVVPAKHMEEHVRNCEKRPEFNLYNFSAHVPPGKPKPEPSTHSAPNEKVEDWDLEPATETYNPSSHNSSKLLVRNIQGASKSERRRFREEQRKLFAEARNAVEATKRK